MALRYTWKVSEAPSIRVIGIDCATDAKKVGLARGECHQGTLRIDEVCTLATWAEIESTVASWVAGSTLLALDAPLGWPAPLGEALAAHAAGQAIEGTTNALFRRETDDVVAARVGKRPLDVGADRIARTAHVALRFLGALRLRTGAPIPLGWTPGQVLGAQAIEVYPAATLATRGWPSSGYKGKQPAARDKRRALVDWLATAAELGEEHAEQMRASDHVLDAALCCLAACDFLSAPLLLPTDASRAAREGWIWVRSPGAETT